MKDDGGTSSNNHILKSPQLVVYNTRLDRSTSSIRTTNDIAMLEEILITKMSSHVEAFMAQRQYVQEKAKKAKEDLLNNIPWSQKTLCWCGDYSQNLDLPHFGSEQPGETYYYSPLNIFIFGLCDHATDKLSAYISIKKEKERREEIM